MDKSLNSTPVASRIHIGFFGRMNAGKSSLINALAQQSVSIVSKEPGTTTDVVKKTMEIHGIGPCVFLDTAGFDDESVLGEMRLKAAQKASESADLAVILFTEGENISEELSWMERFRTNDVPVVAVLSQADLRTEETNRKLAETIRGKTKVLPVITSSLNGTGIEELKEALVNAMKTVPERRTIMGNLVRENDVVLLVMPQDPQAPEGRLILPEVQTIREALDRHCVTVCVQPEDLAKALSLLCAPPDLIITDSQVFDSVYALKPPESGLTSFSILFAAYKGDIDYYLESVKTIDSLTEDSRVLIAECCTHAPLDEDIGRVKIPRMLRQRTGPNLTVDVTAGADFPKDAGHYDLIIQCGGCMLGQRAIRSRIQKAKDAKVPMTNYGIAIAWLKGILDKVSI